jgi:hypothetical protein
MSEPRSDELFHSINKSEEQFDYYILALLTAIVGYFAKDGPISGFKSPSFDIYLVSMTLILLAIYFSFIKLEQTQLAKKFNAVLLSLNEQRGQFMKGLSQTEAGYVMLNEYTGHVYNHEKAAERIKKITEQLPHGKEKMEAAAKLSLRYYKLRNRFFLAGFIGIVVSKIVTPYFN